MAATENELGEDLERIALAALRHVSGAETLAGVVAAEPAGGRRVYLTAFARGDERTWLVLDDDARVLDDHTEVREAASMIALCELAGELAGGGELEELRVKLAELRMTEQPEGIEDAEEAALALERAIGSAPRVATPAYLDRLGAATLTLERALGDSSSPFAGAMRASTGVVEDFVRDVERGYRLELT